MSRATLPERKRAEPDPVSETARYIADLTNEMTSLARTSRLDVLAYLLELVRLEAEEIAQNPARR